MLVAAYLVGGFLIASVYAAGMLRGRRDRYHRLGFLIAFTVAAIATPVQMFVGDELARWVYNNEPAKFAAIELVPKTSSDVPETLFGHLNSNGEVSGGIAIPGLASILSDPSTGTSTVVQGLDAFPKDERPTNAEVNVGAPRVGRHGRARHAARSCSRSGTGAAWLFRRDMPQTQAVPVDRRQRPACCRSSRWRPGWVVTEVGRQPWIVSQLHEGRGRGDHERGRVGHVPRGPRALHRRGRHA